jgi:hypothetical protein
MRTILIILLILLSNVSYTQTNVTVADGAGTGFSLPMDRYYHYSYSESIYWKEDIGQSGTINTISFEWNGNSSFTQNVEVYMLNTTKSSYDNGDDWITAASMTKVYDGSYSVSNSSGWYTITLDSPFSYDNTKNLVVGFYEKQSGYGSASDEFYAKHTAPDIFTYPSIEYHNDTYFTLGAIPTVGDGATINIQYYVPSFKLNITSTLPIELLDFNVTNVKGINHLSWVTLSEVNNDYYLIENSVDGYIWEPIGKVDGAGNSNTSIVYDFNHEQYGDTVNYYRLTQVDYDGRYETFNIISINNTTKKKVIKFEYDFMGQPIKSDHVGFVILIYSDGTNKKYVKSEKHGQ